MWEIHFSKEALKKYTILDDTIKDLIRNKLLLLVDWLQNNSKINLDIKKLKGKWKGFYRIRVKELRLLISFDSSSKRILINDIGNRKDVYK